MIDIFSNLLLGFSVALTVQNILFCFVGVMFGTLIGVLPGLGPVATISLLLPLTYGADVTSAIIMLGGIYYGAQYGGSTTAILLNIPGEATSAVTALDGYPMAQQGRAGEALAIAAIGSFIAGCIGSLAVAFAGPPLAAIGQQFQSPELFSLMVLGLVAAVILSNGSTVRAIAMILVGLLLGCVGLDVNSGASRMNFELPQLYEGFNFVAVALGLFGFAEVISNLETGVKRSLRSTEIGRIWPSLQLLKTSAGAILRGTGLGTAFGLLPGGAAVSSFSSYALEKRVARDPGRFGRGAIEGVAGPESANNAAAQTSFVPLLTLGLPTGATMAVMIGALVMHGITPGPTVIERQPELFWGLIASMFIGNLMLVFINLPMIGLWVRLLLVPYRFLFLLILVVSAIGIYSVSNSTFNIYIAIAFGVFGYVCRKLNAEPAPFLMGFVLGPMMEENFRRSLLLSRGDPVIFFERPISLALMVIAAALLLSIAIPAARAYRGEVFREGEN